MRSFIIPSLFLTSVAGEFSSVHFLVRPNYLLSYSSLIIEKWQWRQRKKQHFDRPPLLITTITTHGVKT